MSKVVKFYKSLYPIAAGHHSITFDYKIQAPKFKPKIVTFRDFKNCIITDLSNEVERTLPLTTDRQAISVGPSALVDTFNEAIISALDRYAPYITRTIKKPFTDRKEGLVLPRSRGYLVKHHR